MRRRSTRLSLRQVLDFPPPARNPLVQALALASTAQGIGLLIGGPVPGSVESTLSPLELTVWGLGLAATGLGFHLAALWRDVVTGVLIEGAACAIGVLSVAIYVVSAFDALGPEGAVLPIYTSAGYALGLAGRLAYIVRDVRRAHRTLKARGVRAAAYDRRPR